MPYEALTPERFRTLKPEFQSLPDTEIQPRIDLASRFVDETWLENDYEPAWAAMTCHLLTLDGLGTSTEAEIAASGGSKLTSLKSGTLSLTFASGQSSGDDFKDWLNESTCGRFYLTLLRLNKGGPRLLTGGMVGPSSGYAKDWPYKFPGVGRG